MNSRQKKLKKGKRYKKEEYKKVMIMASQLLLLVVLEIGVTEGAALQHVVNGDEEELCSVGAQSKSKNKNKKKIHRKRRKVKNNINFSFTFTTTIESFFFGSLVLAFSLLLLMKPRGFRLTLVLFPLHSACKLFTSLARVVNTLYTYFDLPLRYFTLTLKLQLNFKNA